MASATAPPGSPSPRPPARSSTATTTWPASTSKKRRNASRVSLRPYPSVPRGHEGARHPAGHLVGHHLHEVGDRHHGPAHFGQRPGDEGDSGRPPRGAGGSSARPRVPPRAGPCRRWRSTTPPPRRSAAARSAWARRAARWAGPEKRMAARWAPPLGSRGPAVRGRPGCPGPPPAASAAWGSSRCTGSGSRRHPRGRGRTSHASRAPRWPPSRRQRPGRRHGTPARWRRAGGCARPGVAGLLPAGWFARPWLPAGTRGPGRRRPARSGRPPAGTRTSSRR